VEENKEPEAVAEQPPAAVADAEKPAEESPKPAKAEGGDK
jgi:hypothetical protein